MSALHLPSGQEIQLYASEPFLHKAISRDIGRLLVDSTEVNQVVRMARASETIPLGAIALINPSEAPSHVSQVLATRGTGPEADTGVENTVMLRRIDNGWPTTEQAPWAQVALEHGQDGNASFRLGVTPDERAIALELYDAAYSLPGTPGNDEWFADKIGGAAELLGKFVPKIKPLADVVGDFGRDIGSLRRNHDLKTVGNRRPVILERR